MKISMFRSGEIRVFLEKNQVIILQKANQLLNCSQSLPYVGKACLEVNLQKLCKMAEEIKNKLLLYIRLDEKIVFPFFEAHIPRLSPLIHIFQEENKEIKKSLRKINQTLKSIYSAENAKEQKLCIESVGEKIAFFYYLIQSHFEIEKKSLYMCIDQELHSDEQSLLFRNLNNCGSVASIMKDKR